MRIIINVYKISFEKDEKVTLEIYTVNRSGISVSLSMILVFTGMSNNINIPDINRDEITLFFDSATIYIMIANKIINT